MAYSGNRLCTGNWSIGAIMNTGLTIPHEVSDGITLATLIEGRDYLQSELDQWNNNPKDESNPSGYWLHPEDVVNNMNLIRAMNTLIKYYGG
jgi:hypothetical protein